MISSMGDGAFAISTARLRLRPVQRTDLDTILALWTDPDVRRFLWDDIVISRDRAGEEIDASIASFATHGFGLWLTCSHDDGRVVGFVGLRAVDDDVELLVGIAPALWRGGFATEAARAVIDEAFDRLALARVIGQADPPNVASRALMRKLGMRAIGRIAQGHGELRRYATDAPRRTAVV
jgi:ribosomal-protein-alanine N-acetyltransferase